MPLSHSASGIDIDRTLTCDLCGRDGSGDVDIHDWVIGNLYPIGHVIHGEGVAFCPDCWLPHHPADRPKLPELTATEND